jgi:hypothetical protein
VAALFPAVVLLINGWGLSPAAAALVVSALPAATLLAEPLGHRLPARWALGAGVVVLAGGLVGLALLPSRSSVIAAWALASCGFGLGLTLPELVRLGLSDRGDPVTSGSWSVGVRHLGLVLGLLVLTPLLSHDLTVAADRVRDAGAARLLDAPLSIGTKLDLAAELERRVRDGSVTPSALLAPLREREASAPQLTEVRHTLEGLIASSLTRGFRRGFALAAALALLALVPIALIRRRGP